MVARLQWASAAVVAGAALLGGAFVAVRRRNAAATESRRARLRRAADCGAFPESAAGTPERFDPESVADLPDPARRYLTHAIEPDAPLSRRVELSMTGEFRTDRGWKPFTATETLVAGVGFLWSVRLRAAPLVEISGSDYYVDEEGGQKLTLWGAIPFVSASGRGVDRSARGRLVAEYVWLPTALLPQFGAEWDAVDETHAAVTCVVDDYQTTVTIAVDDEGRLREATLDRYRGGTGPVSFGVTVDEEASFGGMTIPSEMAVGWEFGTPGYREFFRATVEEATFY
ncbi:MAG: DUF6920 family protein [Halobacteriota archaeon]